MNIAEISKPSVERSEIKAKPQLPLTTLVEATPVVKDKFDLSEAAKRRYREYLKTNNKKRRQQSSASELRSSKDELNAVSTFVQAFVTPPDLDYSYLLKDHETPQSLAAESNRQLQNKSQGTGQQKASNPKTDTKKHHIDLTA